MIIKEPLVDHYLGPWNVIPDISKKYICKNFQAPYARNQSSRASIRWSRPHQFLYMNCVSSNKKVNGNRSRYFELITFFERTKLKPFFVTKHYARVEFPRRWGHITPSQLAQATTSVTQVRQVNHLVNNIDATSGKHSLHLAIGLLNTWQACNNDGEEGNVIESLGE